MSAHPDAIASQIFAAMLCALALLPMQRAAADPLCADHYPGRTLTWIIPHDVGGGFDAYSRLVGPAFANRLGTEIRFRNVTGAGGRIGADRLKRAPPDGLTIGILNVPGLLAAAMLEDSETANPATDFSILGRIARSAHVWVALSGSPYSNPVAMYDAPGDEPLILGVRDLGSVGFVSLSVSSHLLGLDSEVVAGYKGTRHLTLALLRGEVDIVSKSFESFLPHIERGTLQPLLQISATPVADHPALANVPLIGGDNGAAVERARQFGRDPKQAARDARILGALIGSGRIVAAPLGVAPQLVACLRAALADATTDDSVRRDAERMQRTLEPAGAEEVLADLKDAAEGVERFLPVIRRAAARLRRGSGGG